MESPETGRAVALEFPVSEAAPYPRVPWRIRKRLLVECKTPSTVEEIEAKLQHADLRRQQFYENVSSKARLKSRSPSHPSSYEERLGQRLEAKLQAAEQNRLSILAKAQMRLARLDELRQAVKTGLERRFENEREKLGTKVASRFQQAEVNRMLILKAYSQRRATIKERSSQSLLRRMARESKYKERVRAAIHQKRAAAEKKRLGLLEAKRARARFLRVQRVASSVSHQCEVERSRMRGQLEDKLQRAKRQRAEYLRQRGRLHNSVRMNWNKMHKQSDLLSQKLASCWRQFSKLRKTTLDLAKAFDGLKINKSTVKSMPFEPLALFIESNTTLQTAKALLDRIESRFKVSRTVGGVSHPPSLDNIDYLLKRVATPKRRTTPRISVQSRESKGVPSLKEPTRSPAKLSRYPVRIVLCAYMILGHPDAVFSSQGEQEITLAKSTEAFIQEFELLINIILKGPIQSSDEGSACALPKHQTFRSQLAVFDKAWCSYLNCFVVWKVKDAQSLEEDLLSAACQLELSMIQKCKLTPEGDNSELSRDIKAIQKQVMEDQKLLREKVQHLSGDAGIERMEFALSETRSKYFQARENGNPIGSPITHALSPSSPSSPDASIASGDNRSYERLNHVVRSLFKEDGASPSTDSGSSVPSSSSSDAQLGSSIEKHLVTENELIVHEFLYKQHCAFVDRFSAAEENQSNVKAKVRETIEKAFWDGIMESIRQDEPNYDHVIQLVGEVRDEICEMAPQSWKEEITEAMDLEILCQVLKSGNLDIDYLGKILAFALGTLQKLSSPANDNQMRAQHQALLRELAEICQAGDESNHSSAVAMIKGLRFVLEQIQVLKLEMSKARIRMMECLLKGPAGLDYLRKAFANHYGSPSNAHTSLPVAMRWLLSVSNCKDEEWKEHTESLSALMRQESSSQVLIPSATLKTGGSFNSTSGSQTLHTSATSTRGHQKPECKGERVEMLVRLGLLKLVSEVSGLTSEVLPETFILNLTRLRAVQAEIQKIIVIATSILVCRQTLIDEQVLVNPADMDSIASKFTEQLFELLDHSADSGLEEIVQIISGLSRDGVQEADTEKFQLRRVIMLRTLAKSLQAGDVVFERVSHAVYLASRGVVLGGSSPQGRKLAETALQQVGAGLLTQRVVDAAEVLVVAATISISIHGPWYVNLTDRM
ncbi:hypothetical protein SLE2022_201700 [Rubroshorea leprosula]